MSKFSIKEAFKFSFNTIKNNFLFFLVLFIFLVAYFFISAEIPYFFENILIFFILTIALWVVHVLLSIGITKISLNFIDNKKSDFKDLYKHYNYLLNIIIGSLLYSLIVLAGFVLLIIPGIIWSVKYMFVSYLIIDKNMRPMEAIKKSGEITKGSIGKLLILGLLLLLINIAGMLFFFVGIILTSLFSLLISVYVYRHLLNKSQEEKEVSITGIRNTNI